MFEVMMCGCKVYRITAKQQNGNFDVKLTIHDKISVISCDKISLIRGDVISIVK